MSVGGIEKLDVTEEEMDFQLVKELVLAAISERCVNCTTARIAPNRLAGAAAKGRLSIDTADSIAGRFADCTGFSDGRCHLPPPESAAAK